MIEARLIERADLRFGWCLYIWDAQADKEWTLEIKEHERTPGKNGEYTNISESSLGDEFLRQMSTALIRAGFSPGVGSKEHLEDLRKLVFEKTIFPSSQVQMNERVEGVRT